MNESGGKGLIPGREWQCLEPLRWHQRDSAASNCLRSLGLSFPTMSWKICRQHQR